MYAKFTSDGDSGADEKAPVHVDRYFGGTPGKVFSAVVEIPAPWDDDGDAKETMKELDYRRTGRAWDKVADGWTVKMTALNDVIRHFVDAGYDVTVDLAVARAFDEYGRTEQFMPEFRD